jgi:hypothetical protein
MQNVLTPNYEFFNHKSKAMATADVAATDFGCWRIIGPWS